MNKANRCAVLVTSCDSYVDVWDPFFKLMDNYWTDIPYKVYLNTETIEYNKQYDHFKIQTLTLDSKRKPNKTTWSRRFLDVLDRIEEEYVFVLVEDLFVLDTVQTNLMEQLLDKMDENPAMSQIQFFGTRSNCDKGIKNVLSEEMDLQLIGNDKSKVCFVPTIWRKSVLKKWLRPHESIWAFEGCAAQRARRWKYKEEVYRVYSPAIFDYFCEEYLSGVVNGKWIKHELLQGTFDKNGIVIDYDKRGTITYEEWCAVDTISLIKKYGFWKSLKKAFNRFRSLF